MSTETRPQKASRKVHIGFWIAPKALDWVENLAATLRKDTGAAVSRSDVLRVTLSVGREHENEVIRRLKGTL